MGSLILDPTAITVIRDMLDADDFARDGHTAIYAAVRTLADRGWPADVVSLTDELDRSESLARAGGKAYIHSLATVVPTAVHVEYYAEIVRQHANKRRLVTTAGALAKMGYDKAIDSQSAITQAEQLFVNLQTRSNGRNSGVFHMADIRDSVRALYKEGWRGGLQTCWPELDRHYAIAKGEWTIIHGVPSHGKSSWLDALMTDFAERHNWRFLVSSPENPMDRHFAMIATKYSGMPFWEGPNVRMNDEILADAERWFEEHFAFCLPREGHRNIPAILNAMQLEMSKRRYDAVVLDPWNEFEHDHPKEMTEHQYIGRELMRIKNFARQHQVHVFVVAHPTKLVPNKDGSYPVPRAYQISDSSHWLNKGDNIIAVWRDAKKDDDMVEIHVQKVRFHQNGVPGVGKIHWDRVTGRFDSLKESRG